jgi:hypothetical protein
MEMGRLWKRRHLRDTLALYTEIRVQTCHKGYFKLREGGEQKSKL